MKLKSFLLKSILILFTFSCSPDKEEIDHPETLFGEWKLIQSYVVDGVDGSWTNIENGYTYQFTSENEFFSDKFEECSKGTYILNDENLILKYKCESFSTGLENENGELIEKYKIEGEYLILSPEYLTCDEGCAEKFIRVD